VLRAAASDSADTEAFLNQGVSGDLLTCDPSSDFCQVSVNHETGYLARGNFWGVFPGETVK
jgi:SH3-like domain-containing protein